MEERKLERFFIREIEKLNGVCWKLVVPNRAGVPDRIVLFPGGVTAFAEIKAPGKKPRKLQQRRLERLREMGFLAEVVDSVETAREFAARIAAAAPDGLVEP